MKYAHRYAAQKTNKKYENYKDGSTVSAARTELSGRYAAKKNNKRDSTKHFMS